jgi:hypothetical protein
MTTYPIGSTSHTPGFLKSRTGLLGLVAHVRDPFGVIINQDIAVAARIKKALRDRAFPGCHDFANLCVGNVPKHDFTLGKEYESTPER